MERFRKILVAVDLSDSDRIISPELASSCRAAIDQAIWLAKQSGGKLTFFAVLPACLDIEAGTVDAKLHPHLIQAIASIREDAGNALKTLQAEASQAGIEAEIGSRCGAGWEEICRAVVEGGFDLVIAGSHKRHLLGRALLGSTGQKLVRKCPCPVWVVSPHHSVKVRSILVATDFTEASDVSVEAAKSLATNLGAALHVLHAVEYPHMLTYKAINIPAEYLTDYRFQVYNEAKREFDGMLAKYGLEELVGIDNRHLVSGHPSNAILDTADKLNVDLVVMGSLGRSGWKGLLMGNTAEAVLPQLKCSVLAIKPSGFVCPLKFAAQPAPAT